MNLQKFYLHKKALCLSLFIFFSVGLLTGQHNFAEVYDSDSLLQAGLEKTYQGLYKEAIQEYNKIFKADPNYAKAQYKIAMTYSDMDSIHLALSVLEKLYNEGFAKDEPDALSYYGDLLSIQEENEKAQKIFDECTKIVPESPFLLYCIALMHVRKENSAKAKEYLQKAILLNPNYTGAHFFLGALCLDEGSLSKGVFAMLTCIMLDPESETAEKAILALNVKMSQNYLQGENTNAAKEKDDDFTELDNILRNQLPLHPKYKVKSDIDEIFTRHVQATFEYVRTHEIKNGFFEKTYLPWMKAVDSRNLVEPATYYLLQRFKDRIGKTLTSKQRDIDQFTNTFFLGDFWQLLSKRKQLHFGKEQEVVVFLEDSHPFLVGPLVNGKYEGAFRLINKNYRLEGSLQCSQGNLHGKQTYFYPDGQIREILHYNNGVKEGEVINYYPNGKLKLTENIKNNQYEGPFISYYPNGSKKCEGTYVNDKLEGSYTCYHPEGNVKISAVVKEGRYHGPYIEYNEAGDIIAQYEYKEADITGPVNTYLDGKILLTNGIFINGKPTDVLTTYWKNQQVKTKTYYQDEKIVSSEDYDPLGIMSQKRTFNARGDVESITYHDLHGIKYGEEKLSGDKFVAGYQFYTDNSKPVQIEKNDYTLKYPNGMLAQKGRYKKDKLDGIWYFYYPNGNLNSESDYTKGLNPMTKKFYDKAGQLASITRFKNGAYEGLNINYKNNDIKGVNYFSYDVQNGPYMEFRNDGSTNFEGIKIDGEDEFAGYVYNMNGKPYSKTNYINGYDWMTTYFDTSGAITEVDSTLHLHGEVVTHAYNNFTTTTANYIHGIKSGPYLVKDSDGMILSDQNFKNNLRHGRCKFNNITGTPSSDLNYYCGNFHGEIKYYDNMGNLRYKGNYIHGNEYGPALRYYQTGSVLYSTQLVNDQIHGECTYFNLAGDEVAALGYFMDYVEYYRVLDPQTGKLGDPVPVAPDAKIDVVSYYPNGKKAFTLGLNKSNWHGLLEISEKTGVIAYAASYENGNLHGWRKQNYPDGKPYKTEYFIHDDYEGDQTFYDKQGNPQLIISYYKDEYHGPFKIFKEGKLYKTYTYDTGVLQSMVKH